MIPSHSRGWLRALVLALPLALAAVPFAASALDGVVNLNTASAEDLSLLPGVGPARARAIIELRQQRGGFKRVEDLLEVKGIGESSLAKLKPYLAIEGKSTLSAD
jgi:competence protein ComEA